MGLRPTRQRLAVLHALAQASYALTPAQVLVRARAECPGIGLATVYRTLDSFVRADVVRRVHTSDGCESVALAQAGHGHHVVCQECGRVAEFSTCDIEATVKAAAGETGFLISGHFLEMTGVCGECRAARPRRRGQPSGSRGGESRG
jgi:Fur family transcriptional regulator, ferric uptake regulator